MNSVTASPAASLTAPQEARDSQADRQAPLSLEIPPGFARSASRDPAARPEKHFTPLVQQFLNYLRLERHFSEYTVKSYGADLVQFGQFLGGEIGQPVGATAPAEKVAPTEVDARALKCEPLTIR